MSEPFAPLKWKRLYPGYYEAKSKARFGDKIRDVRIVVQYIREWKDSEWAIEIWLLRDDPDYPEHKVVELSDGPVATRARANNSVLFCLRTGWDWHDHLGWCLTSNV